MSGQELSWIWAKAEALLFRLLMQMMHHALVRCTGGVGPMHAAAAVYALQLRRSFAAVGHHFRLEDRGVKGGGGVAP